jgi:hypothetical protein
VLPSMLNVRVSFAGEAIATVPSGW